MINDRMDKISERYVKGISNPGLGFLIVLGGSAVAWAAIAVTGFWLYAKFAH